MRYDIELPKSVDPYKKPVKAIIETRSRRGVLNHRLSPFITSYAKMSGRKIFVVLGNTSLN